MRLRIINRDYEMLRRSRTIERGGYEARVETPGQWHARSDEVAFHNGMILIRNMNRY